MVSMRKELVQTAAAVAVVAVHVAAPADFVLRPSLPMAATVGVVQLFSLIQTAVLAPVLIRSHAAALKQKAADADPAPEELRAPAARVLLGGGADEAASDFFASRGATAKLLACCAAVVLLARALRLSGLLSGAAGEGFPCSALLFAFALGGVARAFGGAASGRAEEEDEASSAPMPADCCSCRLCSGGAGGQEGATPADDGAVAAASGSEVCPYSAAFWADLQAPSAGAPDGDEAAGDGADDDWQLRFLLAGED